MDPTEKNWTKKYIEHRVEFDFSKNLPLDQAADKCLYKYIQTTGFIYGHPIDLPSEIEINTSDWPVKERMEVILFESLIAAFLLKNKLKGSLEDLNIAYKEITKFYQKANPELAKKGFFESKNRTDEQILESVFSKRVKVKAEWNSSFWQGFFHNILLFGDVVVFMEYLNNPNNTTQYITEYAKLMHTHILHLLTVILNINKDTKDINIKYFHYFLESTSLSKQDKKEAINWHSVSYDKEFQKHYNDSSWLKRKYILDLGVLSVWADQSVSLLEKEMLIELATKLQLDSMELEYSGFAVETFVLNNWNKVHYLQQKQSYLVLSKRITSRMKSITKKYSSFIKSEIAEDKELLDLLQTSQERPLSIDEKDKVRRQLVDVLKLIPAFVVLAMPMAFLTVPILLKILPKELFPSSFNPNALTTPRRRGRNNIIEG